MIGPSFGALDIPAVMDDILKVYVNERHIDERFIDTYRRLGLAPFKTAAYLNHKLSAELV